MQNFVYSIPTRVYFGRGQIEALPAAVREFGSRALLVYGGGSIKASGLYDKVAGLLEDSGIPFAELSGVEPNPRLSTVKRGIELCREMGADVLLPVGGGSCIDCAKAIAAGMYYSGDPWDLCLNRQLITNGLPIVAVSTMAATGSDMDPFGVISNPETDDKKGLGHPSLVPRAAILDPTYTFSVSPFQTAAGTADIISHILETYFQAIPGGYLQKRMCEGLLKTCFRFGPDAVAHGDDYEARANLMWAASWAINGFLKCGYAGPWAVHPIEHQLSAYYDVTHGAGLAVLTPHWFRMILSKHPASLDLFYDYGTQVWELDRALGKAEIARRSIEKTERFFTDLGLPATLRGLGIDSDDKFEIMAEKSVQEGSEKTGFPLGKQDIIALFRACR